MFFVEVYIEDVKRESYRIVLLDYCVTLQSTAIFVELGIVYTDHI